MLPPQIRLFIRGVKVLVFLVLLILLILTFARPSVYYPSNNAEKIKNLQLGVGISSGILFVMFVAYKLLKGKKFPPMNQMRNRMMQFGNRMPQYGNPMMQGMNAASQYGNQPMQSMNPMMQGMNVISQYGNQQMQAMNPMMQGVNAISQYGNEQMQALNPASQYGNPNYSGVYDYGTSNSPSQARQYYTPY